MQLLARLIISLLGVLSSYENCKKCSSLFCCFRSGRGAAAGWIFSGYRRAGGLRAHPCKCAFVVQMRILPSLRDVILSSGEAKASY